MKQVIFKIAKPEQVQTESAQFCAEYLHHTLQEKSVLLLLSGGSAIPMYQELGEQLVAVQPNLSNLTISLVDERYVEVESPDSNGFQLKEKGIVSLFTAAGATWLPYLSPHPETGEKVATRISQQFAQVLDTGAILIMLAGMGDDAHTAGLLPTSDDQTIAQLYDSAQLVAYYEVPEDVPNPYRQRLTSTPKLIERVHQVIAYAVGEKKRAAIGRLVAGIEEIAHCPVLALRHSQSDVIFFTDQSPN